MSSPTNLDDLPPEMINELFKHLPVKDLATCAQVNKRWHSIYIAFKMDSLVVFGNEDTGLFEFDFRHWSYPGRKVGDEELCRLRFFHHLANRPLLSELKHLALWDIRCELVSKVKRFKKLVHLEINEVSFRSLNGRRANRILKLNHPKLKVLVTHHLANCRLSIACPELNVLAYKENENVNLLEVKHPETIRKLETNMVGPKLSRFKRVECLVTREFKMINKTTVLSLPELKELHYNVAIGELFWKFQYAVGTLDKVEEALREFFEDKAVLNRPGFKLKFAGFRLSNFLMLDKIDFGVQVVESDGFKREKVTDEYVYLKNYQLIEPGALHFIKTVDYSRLMDNGGIPDCFARKFSQVQCVRVRGAVEDETNLLQFLRSLSWLRTLNVYHSFLSEELFYDKLPVDLKVNTVNC